MSPTPKPIREQVVEEPNEAAEMKNSFFALYTRGIDRLADVQKRAIDIALQHNAEIADVWKKLGQKVPGAQHLPVLEAATTMFERYADAQKNAIELAVEQSHAWIDAYKDRTSVANKATESAVNMTNQAVERSVVAQKKVLENAAEQTKAAVEAARKQWGFTGAPVEAAVSSFQRGVDTFVEAQKEMLDLVAK
jgi:hypothetical protein